jgi:hypothetical protein
MDKQKILDFLKNNAFALACGVVAVLAVVAPFYPFGGMILALTDKANQEATQYGTLSSYQRQRHQPQIDPTKTTPVDLTGFPTREQVEAGKAAVAKLATESQAAMDVLESLNDLKVHPPLVADALPTPVSDTPKFIFADVYKRVLSLDPSESGLGSPAVLPPVQADENASVPLAVDDRLAAEHALNLCNDVLRAATPPDQKLIDARRTWLKVNRFNPMLITDATGVAVNAAEVAQKEADADKAVPDDLAKELAIKKRVYLDKDAFAVNANLQQVSNPQLADIWFAQLSLWVQTDVAKAVAEMDANAHGVAESPLKRILRLDLRPVPMYQFAGAAQGAAGTGPSPAKETDPIPPTYAISSTGHTSNGMYDVVPFRLTVDLEADHVNQFIATLTHNKLIYVDNQDALFSIDPATLQPLGYLYGSTPVVRLVLSGEELFLRKWTVPLMPQRIQILLGIIPPPPGSTITPLGGPPMLPGGMNPGDPNAGN